MSLGKRVVSVFLIAAMMFGVFYTARRVKEQVKQEIFDYGRTLHVWYADESLTDYLSSVSVKYNEEYGVRVIPVLQTGLEFLEKINEASLTEGEIADLFIASNDSMEKAWLAGLASPISNPGNIVSTDNFPKSAVAAVTYQDMLLGYPLYYETSALLYNRTYFEDQVKQEIAKEEAQAASSEETVEADGQQKEAAGQQEEVLRRVKDMIPETFDELLAFADSYEAPENVEAVFRWDVSDIFFNYFFIGNYIDVGGLCGDDMDSISLYNMEAILALKAYQNLGQYFAIDEDSVDYTSVVRDFIEGKIVMTTATTDIIRRLEEAKKTGEFVYDYGIAPIPDLTREMKTKNLSVTGTIYVNSYSKMRDEANSFAAYLLRDHAEELYSMTGKVTASKQVQHQEEGLLAFMQEYKDSVPMPKMIATGNLWVDMEIVFGRIWEGAEVSTELMLMSERLMSKVTGESYVETYIEMPEESEEYYEFVDE